MSSLPLALRAVSLLASASFAAEFPSELTPLPATSGRVTLHDSGQRLGDATTYGSRVALGDVDGDGDQDAVVVGLGIPTRLWMNDGAGHFSASHQDLGNNALDVGLVDLGGSLLPELVTLHDEPGGAVRVWANTDPGVFVRRAERVVGGDLPSALALGDLGGDLRPDILVTRGLGRPVEIWRTVGDGDFADTVLNLEAPTAIESAVGDLDGDGDADVLVAGDGPEAVWLNQGGAQGGTPGDFAAGGPAWGDGLTLGIALADLDADGDLDALTAESQPLADRIWINQGGVQGGTPARFADSGQRLGPGTGQSRDVAVGDLDGDGDVDAVVARGGGNRVYWNDGHGGFPEPSLAFGNGPAEAVALGDLDGDGDLDVFVVHFGGPSEVWLNDRPLPPPVLPEYSVHAFAGNGIPGGGGDGGPALAASLEAPRDVAVDARGVVYVADRYGERVRRIAADGTISTLIGDTPSATGFSGDGGPVGQARFDGIRSVAVDGAGNLFVADVRNDRIRRIDLQGIVTTVAGNGASAFAGDGGPATQAALRTPTIVRVDPEGTVFFLDLGNRRIRRVDTNGIITTVAGNGGFGFSGDGGPAVAAAIGSPSNLLIGSDGSLYLADGGQPRIRRVSPSGIITTVAGTGAGGSSGGGGLATAARLDSPWGLVWDGDRNLLIGDRQRVRRVDSAGMIVTVAGGQGGGGGDGGPALAAGIEGVVYGMARTPGGDWLFCSGDRVRRLTATGRTVPLVRQLHAAPPGGTEFDFGSLEQAGSGTWPEFDVRLENAGTADLIVRSIEITGDVAPFRVGIRDRHLTPVTLPHRVPEGESDDSLQIHLRCVLGTAVTSTNRAVLRITTDDPVNPVAEYVLHARVEGGDANNPQYQQTLEETLLSLWIFPGSRGLATPSADGPGRPGRRGLAAGAGPQEAVLSVDPDRPRSVTSEIPAYLGGGSVTISNFQGQVRVEVRPDPQDPDFQTLTLLGGVFSAPAFRLPSGLSTGPTTLTFGDRSQSTGRLHRVTGQYSATATATIVNDLFPDGLPVRGSYAGVFDSDTGRARVRSSSVDRIRLTDTLQVARTGAGAVVVWNTASWLEMADRLPGPWFPRTNVVSPHVLDLGAESQRFYRLRPARGP